MLTEFNAEGNPIFAIVAGVALAFFAMTGFENAANVAEETINPSKTFPRALIGGMIAAGIVYVLVAMSAALVVPVDTLPRRRAALLEVIRAGVLPVDVGVMVILFALIAMTAITNTTLVAVVTQSRILYGMARENIFPRMFRTLHPIRRSPWVALIFQAIVVAVLLILGALLKLVDAELDIVGTLANVTVVFLLFIYALVIISALKLRGTGRPPRCLPGQHPAALHRDRGQRGPAGLRHRRSTRWGCSGSSACSPSVSSCTWRRP